MKQKFLKIAGVKNESEFYKKYPTESAFFKAHPEAKELKKAQVGSFIGGEQDVTPEVQSYQDYANLVPLSITGQTQEQMRAEQEKKAAAQAAQQGGGGGLMGALQGIAGGLGAIGGGGGKTAYAPKAQFLSGPAPKIDFKPSALKLKNGKKIKKAQGGATAGILSGAGGQKPDIMGGIAQGLPLIGDIAGAIGSIGQMKKQRKELETARKVSDLALQASRTQPERTARRYVRPEDAIVSPNERFVPGGTGTEILAEYGASIGGNPTEIQNMYNPGDLYSNLGYEPLSESDVVKQYYTGGTIPKAKGGMGFANFMSGGGGAAASSLIGAGFSQAGGGAAAGSQIGGALGKTAGMFLGPVGSAIAEPIGQLLGGGIGAIADAKGAKKQARDERALKQNMETMATESSIKGALGNYSSFVRNGGDIPYAEHGWVSHDWQPQVIAKWGDVNVEDVDDIFRPADMRTLEHGGLLKAQEGMNLPYPNYEERVNRFRDIMGKYSEQELNRRATTEAGLAEYAKLYPNEPFTKEDISFFQDYTTKVLDPQTQAFMQRRGTDWKPGTQRSGTDAIWGPKTQKQPFANMLLQSAPGSSEFKDIGTVREGYATSGTDGSGASDMGGLVPSRINIGGKNVDIKFINKKPYFEVPGTGDMAPYDPSKYNSDTGKYYRTGGSIRQNYLSELDNFNFGGNLKTHWGGRAEVDSYNPYLPGTGETVMFKGNQHSESDGTGKTGIGVSYGPQEHDSYTDYAEYGTEQAADVEVENGEPAAQLPDGNGGLAMTVYGALKINKQAADEIGDADAKGLTYKKYIDKINDKENKANNKLAKANEQLEDLKVVTPFDRLKLNSLQSTIQGENDKLKDYAVKKVTAAEVQNAYNETAEEYGVDADALAKGKIKPSKDMSNAKYGKEIEKAQKGKKKKASDTNVIKKLHDVIGITPDTPGYGTDLGLKSAVAFNNWLKTNDPEEYTSPEEMKKMNLDPRDIFYGKETSSKESAKRFADMLSNDTNQARKFRQLLGMTSSQPSTPLVLQSAQNAAVDPRDPLGLTKIFPEQETSSYVMPPYSRESFEAGLQDVAKGFKDYRKRKSVDAGLKADRSTAAVKSEPSTGEKKKGKTDWLDFAKIASGQLANILRKPLQEDLRGDQLYPEMLTKAQNQLQPVQAQTYQPLLDTPFDVSFQDQLNQNQATFNALQRQIGANPAALSALAAQKYSADKQVLADQFRTNQALRAGVFSKNRDTLNDAALKNLAILDQQYVRQQEALSKTKATDLEIAKSISDKIAKNRLENRTFAAYSNMFPQYGFNRNMMAISQAPTFFNQGVVPGLSPEDAKAFQEKYDQKNKEKAQASTTGKYGKNLKKHFKNGSIVKSLKNI